MRSVGAFGPGKALFLSEMGRILIVDDEEVIGTLTSAILENAGYEADWAPDAERAAEFLRSQTYEAVLLDMNLGKSHGSDLIPDIRAANGRDTRIVVVTAHGDQKTRESAAKSGVSAFILKPFTKKEVLAALKN